MVFEDNDPGLMWQLKSGLMSIVEVEKEDSGPMWQLKRRPNVLCSS